GGSQVRAFGQTGTECALALQHHGIARGLAGGVVDPRGGEARLITAALRAGGHPAVLAALGTLLVDRRGRRRGTLRPLRRAGSGVVVVAVATTRRATSSPTALRTIPAMSLRVMREG